MGARGRAHDEGRRSRGRRRTLCSDPISMQLCGQGLVPGSAGAPWSPGRAEEDDGKIDWIRSASVAGFFLSA